MWDGKRLRKFREEKGITQATLALRTGLEPSAISHMECNRREPSAGTLYKVCKALGVSADYLLGLS